MGSGATARTQPPWERRLPLPRRGLLTLFLLGAFGWSLAAVPWGTPLVHADGGTAAVRILGALLRPDLSAATLRIALGATGRTLAYATAGVSLAILLAFPAGVLASGVLVRGAGARAVLATAARAGLAGLRAIHELVWAWLFVAAIGLSPWAAIVALALPYAGMLGRVLADMLHDVPAAPLRSLAAAGASPWQVLVYGRLPMVWPNMISYALYRYECGIRSAAIMSFVGLGGLGYQIQLSLDDLRFREVWTFVGCLVGLVVAVDLWSGAIRRRLVV